MAKWLVRWLSNHKVAGSIPRNGKYLGNYAKIQNFSSFYKYIFQITSKYISIEGPTNFFLSLFDVFDIYVLINFALLPVKCVNLNISQKAFASIDSRLNVIQNTLFGYFRFFKTNLRNRLLRFFCWPLRGPMSCKLWQSKIRFLLPSLRDTQL